MTGDTIGWHAVYAEYFMPIDQQIALQLPRVDSIGIEIHCQSIRDKYAAIQAQVDEAAVLIY